MTQPCPDTEKELKTQVTELKNISVRKTQLQTRLDQAKAQYAAMLQDMQELQTKLNEGQQRLKDLSDQYMKVVNQAPTPEELHKPEEGDAPIVVASNSLKTTRPS